MIILNRTCRNFLTGTLLLLACVLVTSNLFAASVDSSQYRLELPLNTPLNLDQPLRDEEQVTGKFQFVGLAHYLNSVSYYLVSKEGRKHLNPGDTIQLTESQYFSASGRFNALVIKATDLNIKLLSNSEILISTDGPTIDLQSWLLPKSELSAIDTNLDQLRYAQLPAPLASLARALEWLLLTLQSLTHLNWGLSVILFAVTINLLLSPITRLSKRLQKTVLAHQAEMAPLIAEIKKSYRGEEAHNRIMELYKERHITPFHTLKPMVSLLFQIPVLVAVFNVLGETHQFSNQPFLWLDDLTIPDAIANLTIAIPFFGNTINAFPILMAMAAGISALKYSDPSTPTLNTLRRKQLQLLSMGIIFLILFYPFPATMTLYWLTANVLHIMKK